MGITRHRPISSAADLCEFNVYGWNTYTKRLQPTYRQAEHLPLTGRGEGLGVKTIDPRDIVTLLYAIIQGVLSTL